jgi:hypothetical protein
MSAKTGYFPVLLFLVCQTVLAQASIEDFLGVNPKTAQTTNPVVFKSASGEWRRSGVASNKGLDCAINFVSKSGGIVFIGPTADGSTGTMLFLGTQLAPVQAMTETPITLVTDKDPPGRPGAQVKGFQLPGPQAGIAIATDMAATLRAVGDVKRVSLKHKDTIVFETAMDGMFVARDALAQCMGLPPMTSTR